MAGSEHLSHGGVDTTKLDKIMNTDLRLVNENDDVLNWLTHHVERVFPPPASGRCGVLIKEVFSQGDFVSYTWPHLIYQTKHLARPQIGQN